MADHSNKCSCGCRSSEIPEGVTRKDFLKRIGAAAVGLGIAPLAGLALTENEGKSKEILRSNVVRSGKVNHITLLQTSDIHGQINVHDEFFWEEGKATYKKRGGFAHLKTLINEIRKSNPNTILMDGGDCFQGSAVASLTQGESMIPLMNNLKYDLMLPGNWEVVYGKNALIKDMLMYSAKKVCSNMYHHENDTLLFPEFQIFEMPGVRIGFVGYNDPLTPLRQPPAFSAGIKFMHPQVNIQQQIQYLKKEKGCTMIIALTHMGMTQQLNLAAQPYAEGLDYILGADTHERIRSPLQGKYARVTEPGSFSSFIGRMDLVIEKGKIRDESYELIEVDPGKYRADEEMLDLIKRAEEPHREHISKVLGKSRTPVQRYYVLETPMDNLITDAIMWKAKTDIALSSGYRFCPPLVPAKNEEADITRDYLYSMLPVNSEIRIAGVKGEQLWNWMEQELENVFSRDPLKRFCGWLVRFQGMKVTFTIGNQFGSRLKEFLIQGQKLDRDKTYQVASCERMGDPVTVLCRIKEVKDPFNPGYTMHQVMEEYLALHSPVSPEIEGRAVATDAPSTLLTQVQGDVNYQFR
jgi:2',3'-cyclic-nucleotide 2'-phosphodiesterase (5'-nucleotidase family)